MRQGTPYAPRGPHGTPFQRQPDVKTFLHLLGRRCKTTRQHGCKGGGGYLGSRVRIVFGLGLGFGFWGFRFSIWGWARGDGLGR